jgi:hypothetical protein
MIANRYRGEQPLQIGERECSLRFTWDAIARLRSEYGEDFDRKIIAAIDTKDVAVLAEVIAVGTGLTAHEVMAGSPPLTLAGRAIVDGLRYAYHGQEGQPANPKEARQPATWWSRLMRRLSGLGLIRKLSGG